jgi:hypothetical protein
MSSSVRRAARKPFTKHHGLVAVAVRFNQAHGVSQGLDHMLPATTFDLTEWTRCCRMKIFLVRTGFFTVDAAR